jgi:hypothetical protein
MIQRLKSGAHTIYGQLHGRLCLDFCKYSPDESPSQEEIFIQTHAQHLTTRLEHKRPWSCLRRRRCKNLQSQTVNKRAIIVQMLKPPLCSERRGSFFQKRKKKIKEYVGSKFHWPRKRKKYRTCSLVGQCSGWHVPSDISRLGLTAGCSLQFGISQRCGFGLYFESPNAWDMKLNSIWVSSCMTHGRKRKRRRSGLARPLKQV